MMSPSRQQIAVRKFRRATPHRRPRHEAPTRTRTAVAMLGRRPGTRTIIVGVDGSQNSLKAARCAAILAKQMDVSLLLIYVRPFDRWYTAIRRMVGAGDGVGIDAAVGRESPLGLDLALNGLGVRWRMQVRKGDPGRELARSTRAVSAELVVIGGAGLADLPEAGRIAKVSVLEQLRQAPVPLLVVN